MICRDQASSSLYCGEGAKKLAPRMQEKFSISRNDIQLIINLEKHKSRVQSVRGVDDDDVTLTCGPQDIKVLVFCTKGIGRLKCNRYIFILTINFCFPFFSLQSSAPKTLFHLEFLRDGRLQKKIRPHT